MSLFVSDFNSWEKTLKRSLERTEIKPQSTKIVWRPGSGSVDSAPQTPGFEGKG